MIRNIAILKVSLARDMDRVIPIITRPRCGRALGWLSVDFFATGDYRVMRRSAIGV